MTPRWRETDSNHRYPAKETTLVGRRRSIPRNSPSAKETGSFAPGTDGSNPPPSSEESANFRFLSKRRASEICRDTAHRYGLQPRSTLGAVAGSGHLCFAGLHRGSIITLAEQSRRSSRFPRTGERPNHARAVKPPWPRANPVSADRAALARLNRTVCEPDAIACDMHRRHHPSSNRLDRREAAVRARGEVRG